MNGPFVIFGIDRDGKEVSVLWHDGVEEAQKYAREQVESERLGTCGVFRHVVGFVGHRMPVAVTQIGVNGDRA